MRPGIKFPTRSRLVEEPKRGGITTIAGKPIEQCYASELRKKYFDLFGDDKKGLFPKETRPRGL